jgi:hypothetical protein
MKLVAYMGRLNVQGVFPQIVGEGCCGVSHVEVLCIRGFWWVEGFSARDPASTMVSIPLII